MVSLDKLNPAFLKEIIDPNVELKAFLVIDSYVSGRAAGGIRVAADITLEEVANLAREMSLKYGFLNIKIDGAKAGIVMPASMTMDKREKILRAFGKAISSFIKDCRYFPSEDLGIDSQDLSFILSEAKVKSSKNVSSELFTALTVFLTSQEILKMNNIDIRTQTIIIEGFGKVGLETAKLFFEAKAKIIGVSTIRGAIFNSEGLDLSKIMMLRDMYGDNFISYYEKAIKIDNKELLLKNTDILIPGARPDSINNVNAAQIKAKIIVPIANIPATETIEKRLFERDIIYIPGFVSNCGGVLVNFLADQGFSKNDAKEIIEEGFPTKLRKLFNEAKSKNLPLSSVARMSCNENIEKIKTENRIPLLRKISLKRTVWMTYKMLLNIKAGFFLSGFAKSYIKERLFI